MCLTLHQELLEMETINTIKKTKRYMKFEKMYELLLILGDDYVKLQNLINIKSSPIIDTMLSFYESEEEYEKCSYLHNIRKKLSDI